MTQSAVESYIGVPNQTGQGTVNIRTLQQTTNPGVGGQAQNTTVQTESAALIDPETLDWVSPMTHQDALAIIDRLDSILQVLQEMRDSR